MAVIVAGKFDDHSRPVQPRASAGAHRRFSSGVHQPHSFDRRHGVGDQLGQLFSATVGAPKLVPLPAALSTAADHLGMSMAENQRSPRADVIDVSVAIDIEMRPLRRGERKSARRQPRQTRGPGCSLRPGIKRRAGQIRHDSIHAA